MFCWNTRFSKLEHPQLLKLLAALMHLSTFELEDSQRVRNRVRILCIAGLKYYINDLPSRIHLKSVLRFAHKLACNSARCLRQRQTMEYERCPQLVSFSQGKTTGRSSAVQRAMNAYTRLRSCVMGRRALLSFAQLSDVARCRRSYTRELSTNSTTGVIHRR